MTTVKHLNDDTFDAEVLEADRPVLVDFYADWCGPCRAQAPIVEGLAGEYAGRATVGKVDIEEARNLAWRYGITTIPTLVVFDRGKVIEKLVGTQTKGKLASTLDARLAA